MRRIEISYIDWGREEEFPLAGIGPGECRAGVLDMIEADLHDAKITLEEAEKEDYSPQKIKKALLFSARSLLKEETSLEERKEKLSYAKEFFEHIKELYKNMDSNFNFPTRKSEESEEGNSLPHKLCEGKAIFRKS
ncbi:MULTISPECIES: hypothetical protein [Dictyoglomus]|jgi:predicted component of type VI protein secretion system|uniref:hypothetical protein n=1 Tax=Dictyoglomus TaxID=13 RepID=UPI000182870B|nr:MULTISPECIES: hypothetical protein [Dictyoglomus]PNV79014.1 MAG: hypothetical protein C0196_07270 [Dictyoglomus turgidum]HBU31363.1 hypothetical protein [Dictyoglomus sp.]